MNNETDTDEKIVRRVLQGSIDSFRVIVERYQRTIYAIGIRFFRNRDDSNDFTQEVFIKAYESLRTYAGRAPFRFWLSRIAYNHGINRQSGAGARATESVVSDEQPATEATPETGQMRKEIRDLLLDAMERLPERYRICLDFYFFLGLTYGEISEITGFPVNTIKSHVLRAKTMLRDGLKGTIAEEYHEL
jgi:RNA polymerase sigma-70 factor (ECF subfamily)